jgi:cellulose synthase/poly-beta-1,6-N-acetylglucosamine synthase-like glycosyltransferase
MRIIKIELLPNIYFILKSLCCVISLIFVILIINKPKITNGNKVQNYQKNQITTSNIFNKKLYWKNQTSLEIEKVRDEIKNYDKFQISFENETDFLKREHPKVSIVITLYNQKKYIKNVYSSIQKQELKDIEIIFVDDASIDNSSMIIDELMERDKRIIYLKNDINRLAFYSRNKGVLESKGEYILVIDPDDLLVNNILLKAYETAKEFNLDIVQFYMMIGTFNDSMVWDILKYRNGILYNIY